jgi:hypothetical protein
MKIYKIAQSQNNYEKCLSFTPEDIAKGRGGPIAEQMEENGIAYNVNCLPEGHKWLIK